MNHGPGGGALMCREQQVYLYSFLYDIKPQNQGHFSLWLYLLNEIVAKFMKSRYKWYGLIDYLCSALLLYV